MSVNVEVIQESLKTIIKNKLTVKDEIVNSTKLTEDLGADSLDLVELVMQIEEEFDIEIPDEEFENIATFGELVDLIVTKK